MEDPASRWSEQYPVSIIIPCYNRENLIDRAIESAVVDSPTAEIIVVDDGSTDRSWDQISLWENVIARRTENRGVSAARNTGLALASRTYVRFVDSDDTLVAGSTALLLDHVSRNCAPVGRADDPDYGFVDLPHGARIPMQRLFSTPIALGLTLLPRDLILSVGGFNETVHIGEDQLLAVCLAKAGLEFQQIDDMVYLCGHTASNRLTRNPGGDYFDLHSTTIAALSSCATSQEEKSALARQTWILGREASRRGFRDKALSLFAVAHELNDDAMSDQPAILKLLYALFDPFRSERLLVKAKRLAGR